MKSLPNKFKISTSSTDKLKFLKSKTGLTPNILCRFAVALALSDSKGMGNASTIELDGQEFNSSTLFGDHADLYEVLLQQFFYEHGLKDDVVRHVAALVEIGLHKMGHVRSLKDLVNLAA